MTQDYSLMISYSSADFDNAYQLAQVLESHGYTVWMAPDSILGGEEYMEAIVRGIKSSKIILYVLSSNFSTSVWCPKELEEGIKQRKILLPYQIEKHPEIAEQIRFMLNNVHIIDAANMGEKAIRTLLDTIAKTLNPTFVPSKNNFSPSQVSVPKIDTNATLTFQFEQPSEYFGNSRDQEIDELKERLAKNRYVAIYGIGGQGKSELSKGFAKKALESGQVDKVHRTSWKGNLRDTVRELHFTGVHEDLFDGENERFQQKLTLLNQEGEKTLLIIDNMDDYPEDLDDLFSPGRFKVLITTRRNDIKANRFRLDGFNPEQELIFFAKHLMESTDEDSENNLSEKEKKQIIEIGKMVEHHPLALELIAKSIAQSGAELSEILCRLNELGFFLQVEEDLELHYHQNLSGSIDQLILSLFDADSFDEYQKVLLRILSLAPLEGLSLQELKKYTGLKNLNPINQLVKQSWIIKEGRNHFRMHPLIQKVVYTSLKPDDSNTGNLYKILAQESAELYEKKVAFRDRIINSQMIFNAVQSFGSFNASKHETALLFGRSLFHNNHFDQAALFLAQLEKNVWENLDLDPSTENFWLLNEILKVEGRIQYQLRHPKRSLTFFEQIQLPQDPFRDQKTLFQVIDVHSYKGWALYLDRQFKEANSLFAKEAKLFEHSEIVQDIRSFELKRANYLYNYAVNLCALDEIEQAETVLSQAMKFYIKHLNDGHLDLTSSKNQLGWILAAKGNVPDSYKLYKEVLEQRKRTMGLTHMHTATSFQNVSEAAYQLFMLSGAQEYLDEALEMINQAIAIRREKFPDSDHLAFSILHKARILMKDINIHEERIKNLINEAEKILENYHDPVRQASLLETKAAYFLALKKDESALEHYNQALNLIQNVFQEKHYRVQSLRKKVKALTSNSKIE